MLWAVTVTYVLGLFASLILGALVADAHGIKVRPRKAFLALIFWPVSTAYFVCFTLNPFTWPRKPKANPNE